MLLNYFPWVLNGQPLDVLGSPFLLVEVPIKQRFAVSVLGFGSDIDGLVVKVKRNQKFPEGGFSGFEGCIFEHRINHALLFQIVQNIGELLVEKELVILNPILSSELSEFRNIGLLLISKQLANSLLHFGVDEWLEVHVHHLLGHLGHHLLFQTFLVYL
jgi:hypothetical protein